MMVISLGLGVAGVALLLSIGNVVQAQSSTEAMAISFPVVGTFVVVIFTVAIIVIIYKLVRDTCPQYRDGTTTPSTIASTIPYTNLQPPSSTGYQTTPVVVQPLHLGIQGQPLVTHGPTAGGGLLSSQVAPPSYNASFSYSSYQPQKAALL
jgi:hypothetical protein